MDKRNENICFNCKGTGIVFYTKEIPNYWVNDEEPTKIEYAKKCSFCNGRKTLNNNDNEEVQQ